MTTLMKGAASSHRLHQQPTTSSPSNVAPSNVGISAQPSAQQPQQQEQSTAMQAQAQQPQQQQQPRTFFPRKQAKLSPQPQQQQSQSPFSSSITTAKTTQSLSGAATVIQTSGGQQQMRRTDECAAGDQATTQSQKFAHKRFQPGGAAASADELTTTTANTTGRNALAASAAASPRNNGMNGSGGGGYGKNIGRGSSSSFAATCMGSDNPSPFFGGFGADGDTVLSETNLYIRGLSEDCTDEKLREMCIPYGKIVSTKAILDKTTKKCRGYGFVDFDDAESAHAAIKGLMEHDGAIHAQMAKQQEQDPTNLYIANLPPEFDEDQLSELLQPHGLVISSRILRNPDLSSRGVGFCRMTTAESCASIIAEFHGKKLGRNAQPLIVKLADSSNRKSKRSTPSLRSFYSGESSGYKAKMSAPPLMHHSLMDSFAFQSIPSHPAAVAAMALNNSRYGGHYGAAPHPYSAAATIPDLLSAQFQQIGLANAAGNAGPDLGTAANVGIQTAAQVGGVTPTEFQQQLQQQISQQQQQQPIFYQSNPASYYQMPYYMPATAAAPTCTPYAQQPLFLYPQDYFTFALQQQQAAAAAAATGQIGQATGNGNATTSTGLTGPQQQQAAATMLSGGVFHPQQQNPANLHQGQPPPQQPQFNPYSPGSGATNATLNQQQQSASLNMSTGGAPQHGQEQSATQQLMQQQIPYPSTQQQQQHQQQVTLWSAAAQQTQPAMVQLQQQATPGTTNNWRNSANVASAGAGAASATAAQ